MKIYLKGDYPKGRHYLRNYNPIRLRRLCRDAERATIANGNGWANTQMELWATKDELDALKALYRALEHDYNKATQRPLND